MFKYIWLVIPPLIFILMMSSLFYVARQADKRTIRYDCSIAEISPDFPVEVKNACRKKLSGRI
jgi:hypothetical protein